MRKVFNCSIAAFVLIAGAFVSCSDDDTTTKPFEEGPQVNIPPASAEEIKQELASIATALTEMQGDDLQLNNFLAQFSATDFNLDTNELTVFAFEDDRAEDPDALNNLEEKVTTKSTNFTTTAENKKNIHHHILKGKHNLNFVTADKEYVYKTINGTEIIISKRNNVIYVNGIAMKKNEFYKNNHGKGSYIYCIKDELPEDQISASKVDDVYDIKVMNINIGDTKNPYTPSKDAFVIVYEDNGHGGYKYLTKVRTNDEGYTSIFYKGNKTLYYKASNKAYKYIYKGFIVAGMYQTAEEVANALPHTGVSPLFMPKIGGVKFLDVNGDGKIDFNDKKGAAFIKLNKDADLNTVYLANPQY